MRTAQIWLKTIMLLLAVTFTARADGVSQQPSPAQHAMVEVHLSQDAEHTETWLKVIDRLIWPAVIVLALALFRIPLLGILTNIATNGAKLSGFGLEVQVLQSTVKAQTQTISDQQEKIDKQSERIRNLIKFSMSVFIYEMLRDLKTSKEAGKSYIYREDDSMFRNLRFLIDHGYIHEIHRRPNDLEDICPIVTITPSGEDVIVIRESPNA